MNKFSLVVILCRCTSGLVFCAREWETSPVVVGGTGGSGTRGVVQVLQNLGVYMHPPLKSSLFRDCYNGDPLDNTCMFPVLATGSNSSMFSSDSKTWLTNATCAPHSQPSQRLCRTDLGSHYFDSVPGENRRPYYWGWKNPRTMYHLEVLYELYPNLLFIHVLRNPMDMASAQWQHLKHRAKEFAEIHSDFETAEAVMRDRCDSDDRANCVVPRAAMLGVSECTNKSPEGISECAKRLGSPKKKPWRCLHAQLWAEMNTAVRSFGQRCLGSRYLSWHAEDVYGLRGAVLQEKLVDSVSKALQLPADQVAYGFRNHGHEHTKRRRLSNGLAHRRLSYGKYLSTHMDVAEVVRCAESAISGALSSFEYPPDSLMNGGPASDFEVDDSASNNRMQQAQALLPPISANSVTDPAPSRLLSDQDIQLLIGSLVLLGILHWRRKCRLPTESHSALDVPSGLPVSDHAEDDH